MLLLGPSGVGKTHLTVALGISAYAVGLRTMFTAGAKLITTLDKALYENQLQERLKVLTQPWLHIIDEIGYIPDQPPGRSTEFQSIRRRGITKHRYEAGSDHASGSIVTARSGAFNVSRTSSVGMFRRISSR